MNAHQDSRHLLLFWDRWLLPPILIHCLLSGIMCWTNSPCVDEIGHLPSGLCHWVTGEFDSYRVNPPLVRMIAALPVLLTHYELDWWRFYGKSSPDLRVEFFYGRQFLERNGPEVFWYFTLARWSCMVFGVLSILGVYHAARFLYGTTAGRAAAWLWSFHPLALAYGSVIAPDMGATALGLWANYALARYLEKPDYSRAALAGILFGIAQLTKMTWIVLFAVWPLLWMIRRWYLLRTHAAATVSLGQLLAMGLIGIIVLNAGYGFDGTGKRLDSFLFVSGALTNDGDNNRFLGSPLGSIRLPLPEQYVLGMDYQKGEFEGRHFSYLRGTWRPGEGWWWYYLYAVAIKTPIPILILFIWGMVTVRRVAFEETAIFLPMLSLLVFVSSQTGMNHHVRYVLPGIPLMILVAARLFRTGSPAPDPPRRRHSAWAWLLVALSCADGLFSVPHSLAYFNAFVGGPAHTWRHLSNSNVDWGQGLFWLKRWHESHPEATPLTFLAHIPSEYVPTTQLGLEAEVIGIQSGLSNPLHPGWYAISASRLTERDMKPFQEMQPVAIVARSILIFHIPEPMADSGELGHD